MTVTTILSIIGLLTAVWAMLVQLPFIRYMVMVNRVNSKTLRKSTSAYTRTFDSADLILYLLPFVALPIPVMIEYLVTDTFNVWLTLIQLSFLIFIFHNFMTVLNGSVMFGGWKYSLNHILLSDLLVEHTDKLKNKFVGSHSEESLTGLSHVNRYSSQVVKYSKVNIELLKKVNSDIRIWNQMNYDMVAYSNMSTNYDVIDEIKRKMVEVEERIIHQFQVIVQELNSPVTKDKSDKKLEERISTYLSKEAKSKEPVEIQELKQIVRSEEVSPLTRHEAQDTLDKILTKEQEYPGETNAKVAIDVAKQMNGIKGD